MARMLARSKSLRLRSSQKDLRQQEEELPAPPLTVTDAEPREDDSQTLKPAAHAANAGKRIDTPDLVQRPRTSGGPGDRGRHFHKKGAPIAITSDDHTFNFPLPAPKTVLYTAEIHEDSTIGMAIGSPTTPARWNRDPHATDFVTNKTGTTTKILYDNSMTDSSDTSHDAVKPKISRWRSLFGRKTSNNAQHTPFYLLQQFPSTQTHVDSRSDVSSQRPRAASRSASRAASRAASSPTAISEKQESRKKTKATKKAAADQAKAKNEAENFTATLKSPITREEESPEPPPKDNWDAPAKIPKVTISSGSENNSPRTLGPGLMLDVDIPDIQMERYSVMFGSLLRPDRSSSLFIRRQANPEKLKPLNELSVKTEYVDSANGLLKPQRRATSPSPSKSPTFSLSLFPPPAQTRDNHPPSPRVTSLHRPRPLQRSNTAPGALSPSRQTFAQSDDAGKKSAHAAQEEPPTPELATHLMTPTPSTIQSFDSEETEATLVVAKDTGPWKPRLPEPEWEIVAKSVETPSQVEGENSPRPAKVDEPTPETTQVSVGVARTVSVSRSTGARPQFLKPMIVTSEQPERLVDRKPLTPTLVELRNRKSQRVQIVEA
ncbi:hypothetical protein AOQ84DRAFT_376953 [Glonium stellatum]|uniref:Uncharacterized protein n=1 Tax=Glonium stellatum TaxID=574774 RepID=A0A8E2F0B3_9PEZI|nr:hypothetical protein AOQ84DRAFT_376953 [Glonium stellatum]